MLELDDEFYNNNFKKQVFENIIDLIECENIIVRKSIVELLKKKH